MIDRSPSAAEAGPRFAGIGFTDSDLGSACREAVANGAERILLLTDGCQAGGIEPPLPGVPVDVHLLPRRDDIGVLEVRAPLRIGVGEPFGVSVRVGRTNGPGDGATAILVRLGREGERVGEPQAVVLGRGETARVVFRDRIDRPGFVRYRAFLEGPAGPTGNDERGAVVRIGDRPLVVLLGDLSLGVGFTERTETPASLARHLARPGVRAAIDAIAIGPGVVLDAGAQAAVVDAVQEGVGLVLVGGGYGGQPLEAVLPLTDTPPSGRAVCLLLDFSGSMEPYKDALLDAARDLRSLLAPSDRVATLAFRGDVFFGESWKRIDAGAPALEALRELRATGRTRLGPALDEALRRLKETGGTSRRLYVVSDGEWRDSESEREELARKLSTARADGIRVAGIFVGDDVPDGAESLLGESYRAGTDVERLKEALRRAEGEAPDRVVPGPLVAVSGSAPAWLQEIPPLGRCFRVPRLYDRGVGGEIVQHAGDVPLLACWHPAGRVVVLAPSPGTNPGSGVVLPMLVRACARPLPDKDGVLRASRRGGSLHLEARGFQGDGPFAFEVGGVAVPARPTGPRAWSAVHAPVDPGPLSVSFAGRGLAVPPAAWDELEGLHPHRRLAAAFAVRSGGRLTVKGESLPELAAEPRSAAELPLLLAILLVLWSAARRRDS